MSGPEFRAKRQGLGLTQTALALEFCTSKRTIIRIEAARSVPPVYKLAMAALENNAALVARMKATA